ncbi:MAG: DUF4124 domain-containing protein [Xanthomonadales bacterium]|nr:DUF4124 domain-containing protein [Xanthomonadales bacterium]
MTHSIRSVSIALLFGYFLIAQAQAQQQKMYSWTDENGVVHFSDVQPDGQQVQEQLIPVDEPPSASSPYATPDATDPSLAEQKRQEIAQKSQQAQANKAMKSAQCSSWEEEVARLEPNRRVYSTNAQGETERMDDVERTDRVAELKSQIAQNCK